MRSEIETSVDGVIDDELNPDFEEFEGNYFDLEIDNELEDLEDEDLEYCINTQDLGFYTDPEGNELDF